MHGLLLPPVFRSPYPHLKLCFLYRDEATFITCLRRPVYNCGYVLATLNKQKYWRNTVLHLKLPALSLSARLVRRCLSVTSVCLQTNGTTFVAFHWFIHGRNNGINKIFNYFILLYSVNIRSISIHIINRKSSKRQ